jgi:hypothetical protein
MWKVSAQQKNVNAGWKDVLADAKRKHAERRKFVTGMRAAIRTIKRVK